MTKTLTPGQNVRIEGWDRLTFAGFNTVRNYKIGDETPDKAFASAIAKGHATAWAVTSGTMITTDKSHYARLEAEAAAAVTLVDGEIIAVEGEPETYKVKVMKGCENSPRFSDPIHFERI